MLARWLTPVPVEAVMVSVYCPAAVFVMGALASFPPHDVMSKIAHHINSIDRALHRPTLNLPISTKPSSAAVPISIELQLPGAPGLVRASVKPAEVVDAPAVVTVTVACKAPLPSGVTTCGETEHIAPGGAPVQVSVIA
jgi:hypothetical protein